MGLMNHYCVTFECQMSVFRRTAVIANGRHTRHKKINKIFNLNTIPEYLTNKFYITIK